MGEDVEEEEVDFVGEEMPAATLIAAGRASTGGELEKRGEQR